jgi:hypothetical protein
VLILSSFFLSSHTTLDTQQLLRLPTNHKRLSSLPNKTQIHITMAAEYQGQDPMVIAKQAERDLNSQKAPLSDSSKSSPSPKKPTT